MTKEDDSATDLASLASKRYAPDRSHVWGEYVELLLNSRMLVRSIEVYPGGATSLHRHEPEELMIVTSGAVICDLGSTADSVASTVLRTGEAIHIPANYYHRLSSEAGSQLAARVLEVMVGEHGGGSYQIVRAVPARPGRKD